METVKSQIGNESVSNIYSQVDHFFHFNNETLWFLEERLATRTNTRKSCIRHICLMSVLGLMNHSTCCFYVSISVFSNNGEYDEANGITQCLLMSQISGTKFCVARRIFRRIVRRCLLNLYFFGKFDTI